MSRRDRTVGVLRSRLGGRLRGTLPKRRIRMLGMRKERTVSRIDNRQKQYRRGLELITTSKPGTGRAATKKDRNQSKRYQKTK